MSNEVSGSKAEVKQVGRFGIVGVINTLIDVGAYNLLFGVFNLAAIAANSIAVTFAVAFSFVANKNFVFRARGKLSLTQTATFLAVTLFSAFVIQNGIIYIFTELWRTPFELAHDITNALSLGFLTEEFVVNNGAKALSLGFGMVWNYLWYKKVVFKS